jgi:hypothetical protein
MVTDTMVKVTRDLLLEDDKARKEELEAVDLVAKEEETKLLAEYLEIAQGAMDSGLGSLIRRVNRHGFKGIRIGANNCYVLAGRGDDGEPVWRLESPFFIGFELGFPPRCGSEPSLALKKELEGAGFKVAFEEVQEIPKKCEGGALPWRPYMVITW